MSQSEDKLSTEAILWMIDSKHTYKTIICKEYVPQKYISVQDCKLYN